jgi:CBS domain-containing protein
VSERASWTGERSLFLHRVGNLLERSPVTCGVQMSVQEIARLLSRQHVGSVIVVDDDESPLGIVTDRDLRRKVVAEARDPVITHAADIMSSPLATISPAAFAFEAILEMTRRDIRHLVVMEDGRLVGVVSMYDFVLAQSLHPVLLAREITRAASLEALAALGARITDLTRQLVDQGGTAYDIGQLISELNDRVVVRVLGLAAGTLEESGEDAPPVAYCWLSFGSEARREQTLRTDQDNGLVYADPPPHLRERAAAYYARLAQDAIRGLMTLGYPPCPAGAMASNPQWCQPLSVWTAYLQRWMHEISRHHVLAACIYFDLRPVGGASDLVAPLIQLIRAEAPTRRVFLELLAVDVVSRRVPRTMFGNVAVHRSGPQRGRVDIKGAGALQLVGTGRLHTLELGLPETNTVDRFRAAGQHGVYSEAETREITDTCQHLMRLRLLHQLEQIEASETPDNFIDPDRLSHTDRLLLREALKTVGWVQQRIRYRFATDFVPHLTGLGLTGLSLGLYAAGTIMGGP